MQQQVGAGDRHRQQHHLDPARDEHRRVRRRRGGRRRAQRRGVRARPRPHRRAGSQPPPPCAAPSTCQYARHHGHPFHRRRRRAGRAPRPPRAAARLARRARPRLRRRQRRERGRRDRDHAQGGRRAASAPASTRSRSATTPTATARSGRTWRTSGGSCGPYNYLRTQPGRGTTIVERDGVSLGIVNLSGAVHLQAGAPPLVAVDEALREVARCDQILVDMHAEVTSEKVALGWYLDGKVTAVVGTHTHVPTADARVLPGGTAYITDVGMTGARGGVIGMKQRAVDRGHAHAHADALRALRRGPVDQRGPDPRVVAPPRRRHRSRCCGRSSCPRHGRWNRTARPPSRAPARAAAGMGPPGRGARVLQPRDDRPDRLRQLRAADRAGRGRCGDRADQARHHDPDRAVPRATARCWPSRRRPSTRCPAGRLVLGVAVGGREDDYAASGADFHSRGRDFDGCSSELERRPGPATRSARRGRPTVIIGGTAAAAFERAAKYADGWIMGGGTPDSCATAPRRRARPGRPRAARASRGSWRSRTTRSATNADRTPPTPTSATTTVPGRLREAVAGSAATDARDGQGLRPGLRRRRL